MCGLKSSIPSSFLRTRSIAPEQPPQDMETLNLYLCSAMVCVLGVCVCVCVEGERERESMRVGVEEGVVLISVVMAWNRGFPLEAVDC